MPLLLGVRRSPQSDLADRTAINRLVAKLEPEMLGRFLRAVERWRGSIDLSRLAEALTSGQFMAGEIATNIDRFPDLLQPTAAMVMKGMVAGAEAAKTELEHELSTLYRFDLVNQRSVYWAQNASSKLITGISEESRRAVREIIARATNGEFTADQAAIEIREIVGLTERGAIAVSRFRQDQIDAGTKPEKVDARTARYSAYLLRRRGLVIARTELITAANYGQMQLWREAGQNGLFTPSVTKVRWLVAHDDRLDRDICAPMAGQEVKFGEPFETPQGRQVDHPPAHPQCRCATRLIFPEPKPAPPPPPPKPPKPPKPAPAPEPPKPSEPAPAPPEPPKPAAPKPAGTPQVNDNWRGELDTALTADGLAEIAKASILDPEILRTLSPKARSFFSDAAFQARFLQELKQATVNATYEAPGSPDAKIRQRYWDQLADYLHEGVNALGWPQYKHNGIIFNQDIPGAAGYKLFDCRIGIDPVHAARRPVPDSVHTLLHESVHARQPFKKINVEYDNWPGFEEGLTESSTRMLAKRLNLPDAVGAGTAYDRYVHATWGIARGVGMPPVALARRLFDLPNGWIQQRLVDTINLHRDQVLGLPPLSLSQVRRFRDLADSLYGRDLMIQDVRIQDVKTQVQEIMDNA